VIYTVWLCVSTNVVIHDTIKIQHVYFSRSIVKLHSFTQKSEMMSYTASLHTEVGFRAVGGSGSTVVYGVRVYKLLLDGTSSFVVNAADVKQLISSVCPSSVIMQTEDSVSTHGKCYINVSTTTSACQILVFTFMGLNHYLELVKAQTKVDPVVYHSLGCEIMDILRDTLQQQPDTDMRISLYIPKAGQHEINALMCTNDKCVSNHNNKSPTASPLSSPSFKSVFNSMISEEDGEDEDIYNCYEDHQQSQTCFDYVF